MFSVENLNVSGEGEGCTTPLLTKLRQSVRMICNPDTQRAYLMTGIVVAWRYDHIKSCVLIGGYGNHPSILQISAVGVNTEGQSSHELPCLHVSKSPTQVSPEGQILTTVRHVLVSTVCIYCARLAFTKAVNHRVIERILFDLYTSHVVLGIVRGHIVYVRSSTSPERCGDVRGVVDNKSCCRCWPVFPAIKALNSVRTLRIGVQQPLFDEFFM